jgi:hypothetical protein
MGSQYQLMSKSELFIGYQDDGTKITIPANTVLRIKTWDENGNEYVAVAAWSKKDGPKAFIKAVGVEVEGKLYPLPNGEYEWQLLEVASGYWDNEEKTYIDAKWKVENQYIPRVTVNQYPVIQTRQTATITTYVKYFFPDESKCDASLNSLYYTHGGHASIDGSYKDNSNYRYAALKPAYKVRGPARDRWQSYIKLNVIESMTSNKEILSTISTEVATVYKNETLTISVTTKGLVPNTVYDLYNIGDIVDINTGEVIRAGTTLGSYMSDENGTIIITTLGTEEFSNPNTESSELMIDAVSPQTINGSLATHVGNTDKPNELHALPNGSYALSVHVTADGFSDIEGLSEDIIFATKWESGKDQIVNTQSVVILRFDPEDPDQGIPMAPTPDPDDPESPDPNYPDPTPDDDDPKNPGPGGTTPEPEDPYDPNMPDDPRDPDDSEDIPLVDKDWVDAHKDDLAYRVVDSDNLDDDGKHEVKDVLPVTFSFYLNDDFDYDEIYEYSYKISFYYQITKTEYNDAPQYMKDNGTYLHHEMIPEDPTDDLYMKKFSNSQGDADYLRNIIVLNENSTGFVDYNEIERNRTISGAIYNTEWLDERFAIKNVGDDNNGEYQIYVKVDVTMTYLTKANGVPIVRTVDGMYWGTLTIKNRQLFPLD